MSASSPETPKIRKRVTKKELPNLDGYVSSSSLGKESIRSLNIGTEKKDYKKIAKKLSNDKKELKAKMITLLEEVESRNKAQREALDNYQAQINELISERDKLLNEKYEHDEDEPSKETEDLRKKIATKEATIKRLETNIKTLQEKKGTTSEETLRKNISDLEEALVKTRDLYNTERESLQALVRSFQEEKEYTERRLKLEKQEEIEKIISEKDSVIRSLQAIQVQIEKRAKAADVQRDELIQQAKLQSDKVCSEYEEKFRNSLELFEKNTASIKQNYETKLAELVMKNDEQINTLEKSHKDQILALHSEYEKKLSQQIFDSKLEIESMSNRINDLHAEIKRTAIETSNHEQEMRKKYETMLEKANNEFTTKIESKDREYSDLKLKADKNIGELEDINRNLKDRVVQTQDTIKKLQDNNQTMNMQFVNNLNKQKEIAEREITNRDNTIAHLERSLKRVGEESVDRFNALERKLKITSDELESVLSRQNSLKERAESAEEAAKIQKAEMHKHKEIADIITEKIRRVELQKETTDKRIAMLEAELKAREDECAKYKGDTRNFMMLEMKHKEELNKALDNVNKLQLETDAKKRHADEMSSANKQLQGALHALTTKLKTAETAAEKFSQSNSTILLEKETIAKAHAALLADYTRFKESSAEELRDKVAVITADRDKLRLDTSKKIEQLVLQNNVLQKEYDQAKMYISKITSEKDALRQIVDSQASPDGILGIKVKEIERLEKENNRIRSELGSALSELSLDNKCKEQEINVLRERTKDIAAKDAQITSLEQNLEYTRNMFKSTVDNLTADHRKEKDELILLRDKVKELFKNNSDLLSQQENIERLKDGYERRIIKLEEERKAEKEKILKKLETSEAAHVQYEQRIEKLKLEFYTQLNEAKRMPPEGQEKLAMLEKKCNELSIQLATSEDKLNKMHRELANREAEYSVSVKALKAREADLKKAEDVIKNTPPKLLDPSIKKSRDEALATLRLSKLELSKVKDECIQLTQKLQTTENLIQDLEREKRVMINSQNETKEAYVTNLNQQQAKHEKEMGKLTDRISELEKMLFAKQV